MKSPCPPRYTRRLSAMERYSLVIHRVYHYHVDGVVEGTGHIDPVLLRAAIARAAAANPGVRVRLRGWLGLAKWVDSGKPPELRVVNGSDWDGASEMHTEFMTPRLEALGGGPVTDMILLRGSDQRTRLVFRGLHAAIDGRGMMHWMTEVFRALRGEELLGSASTLTDLDIQEQFRAQTMSHPAPPRSPACIPVVAPAPPWEPLEYIWRRIVIPRAVTSLLTRSAVFMAAWARRNSTGDVGFTIPVDYRGSRTAEMGVGNMTGYVRLNVTEADTSRNLMLKIKKSMAAFDDCRQFPGIRVILWLPVFHMAKQLLNKLTTVLYTVNKDSPSGGIVSMGAWKNEWFSCPGFQSEMTYGIPGSVGKLNVLFVNYPDFAVVLFAAPAAYNREGQLDAMIHAYQQNFQHVPAQSS